jgi:excinuclease UvrABC helicase subunit UvrB
MNNKEFTKMLEELLKDLFGGSDKSTSTFNKKSKLNDEWTEIRRTIREGKDGFITSFYYTLDDNRDYPWTAPERNKMKDLEKELNECVKNQEFEKAVILRDKIKSLKNNSSKIDNLKKELEIAIKEQNFEKAIELRDELKSIN